VNSEARTAELRDARRHLLALFEDLDEEQLIGPALEIVNPPLWEVGHVAWFQERWMLRERACLEASYRADADELYDSIAVHHPDRWRKLLPPPDKTLEYMRCVLEAVEGELADAHADDRDLEYFSRLVLYHEDMHVEAMVYTRQTLAYPAPSFLSGAETAGATDSTEPGGDVEVPGGEFRLGAADDGSFVFDNEKWAHAVPLAPFRIARHAVTQAEFLEFVDDAGYDRREYWSAEGWRWREEQGAAQPVYWDLQEDGSWLRRAFDRWVPLESDLPMQHVSWHEAQAYCRWADRRLPTEAEWEAAAALDAGGGKRRFPWGADESDAKRANTDFRSAGCVPVDRLAAGDSFHGCRQLVGNLWEWTDTTFAPYPGFVRDPYAEYSEPWFGTRKVLRGGAWASRARMLRNTWRNFFTPDRRDVFAGFRTCALDA